MDIFTAFATKNPCYREAQKMTPKGIIVHSTGANNPHLKRYVDCEAECGKNEYGNHWNRSDRKGLVHAFIGYDKDKKVRIAQVLPYDMCCWGCGNGSKGSYNYDPAYIQFEICEDALVNETYFNSAFSAAIEYCAFLAKKYNIPVKDIISHAEAHKRGYATNHADCDHWLKKFNKTMDWFRAEVQKLLDGEKESEKPKVTTSIKAGDLVKIKPNATYYTGGIVPTWVTNQNWYVKEVKDDRALIDKNEKGTNSINSPINVKFLEVVSASKTTVSTTKPTVTTTTKPTTPTFKVGDRVKCKPGVNKFSNGAKMASWVPRTVLYIRAIESNGKIFLVSTEKVKKIYTGRVKASDVQKA